MLNIDSQLIIFHINPYDGNRELLFRIIVRVFVFVCVLWRVIPHLFEGPHHVIGVNRDCVDFF